MTTKKKVPTAPTKLAKKKIVQLVEDWWKKYQPIVTNWRAKDDLIAAIEEAAK